MDQLKLKYIIELVSNLGPVAQRDAKQLTDAQQQIQKALADSNREVGLLERVLLRMGEVASASAARQADYLGRLEVRYHDVRKAAEGALNVMTRVAQVGAGTVAGGVAGVYTADRLLKGPADYESQLAGMANTAFNKDDAGRRTGADPRRAGMALLDAGVRAAVRVGGGSREDVAGALNEIIGSGVLRPDAAIRLLPTIAKASSASGASAKELGLMAVRAMTGFGIKEGEMSTMLGWAMTAGQEGGFELTNMAHYLPEQMAMARALGMSGMADYKKLLAWNQASVLTAGTKDQAGINLKDLLNELNSQHFKGFMAQQLLNDGKRLPNGQRAGLIKNIDQIYLDYQSRGVGKVDATLDLLDKMMMRDKGYVALKAQLERTGDQTERGRILTAMATQMQGSALGKIFHNQQSFLSLSGIMNNQKYVADVLASTGQGGGEVATAFDVMAGTSKFKRQQMLNEVAFSATDAFNQLAPSVNKVFDSMTDLARENPKAAASVAALGAASAVAAAAIGASGIAGMLLGRDAATGALAGAAGRMAGAAAVGATAAGAATGTGGLAAGAWAMLRKAGGLPAILANELFFTSDSDLAVLREADARRHHRGAGFNDPRLLKLTEPPALNGNGPGPAAADGRGPGNGTLLLDVRVSDERISVLPTVTAQPSGIRIDPGHTNPGSYAR